MSMNKYEVLYIIRTDLEEEAIKAVVEKFSGIITANGGTIEKCDEWGKRRLAYPINDMNEGYYVLFDLECVPSFPAELDRVVKITEGIMRSIIICKDDIA